MAVNMEVEMDRTKSGTLIMMGGTGFIGVEVVKYFLFGKGNTTFEQILVISRQKKRDLEKTFRFFQHPELHILPWDESAIFERLVSTIHKRLVLVNLVGENIIKHRWSPTRKEQLIKSRVETTEWAGKLLENLLIKDKNYGRDSVTWLNASAVGIYDDQPGNGVGGGKSEELKTEELKTEESPATSEFLGELCTKWEAPLSYNERNRGSRDDRMSSDSYIRRVILRFGVVLGEQRGEDYCLPGALQPIKLSVQYLMGAILGTGRQSFPWIYLEEIPLIIDFILVQPGISGSVNLVAPEMVDHHTFMKSLGRALGRPIWQRIPGWVLRVLLGERARVVLYGPRVIPRKLLNQGYQFRFPDLKTVWKALHYPRS